MTTILTKKKDTTGAPAPGDLTNAAGGAELAVNTFDKRLYTKDSGGNVVEIGTNPTILNIDNIEINGNTISSTNSNGNINLTPNGTGSVVVSKLQVTGTFQLDGNVTVGDTSADTLTVNSTITSNLIFTDNTYDIGASGATRPRTGYFGTSVISPLFVAGAGTVSAPAITTTGDTNTGIFFPAADTIAFTEGGAEAMRIDSSGNVGIGTSSPAYRLDVNSTGAAPIRIARNGGTDANTGIQFSLASAYWGIGVGSDDSFSVTRNTLAFNSSTILRITSAGDVGIGTASPVSGYKLTVAAGTNQTLVAGAGGTALIEIGNFGGAGGGGYNGLSFSGSNLRFYTGTAGGTSVTERMRIIDTGNVGIGTSSPSLPLQITAGNKSGFNISYDNSGGLRTGLFMWTAGGSDGSIGGGVEQTSDNVFTARSTVASFIRFNNGETRFFNNASLTSGNTYTPTERMRIDSSGNVGIGISSPQGRLYVNGADTTTIGDRATAALVLNNLNGVANNRYNSILFGGEVGNTNSAAYVGFRYTSGTASGFGDLVFGTRSVTTDTAPTERMRITSAGDVGIGVTPTAGNGKLQVQGANTSTSISSTPTATLYDGNANNEYCILRFATNSDGSIVSIGGKATTTGAYPSSVGTFEVGVQNGATTNTVITVAAGKSFALQGATSDTGIGISFPATQSASSDANTLDDYEEGTWTPFIADDSSGGNSNSTNSNGWYTKIGNQVTVYGRIDAIITTGLTAANQVWIRNLPFTSANTMSVTTGPTAVNTITFTGTAPIAYLGNSATGFRLYAQASGGGAQLLVSSITSGTSWIYFVITYQV